MVQDTIFSRLSLSRAPISWTPILGLTFALFSIQPAGAQPKYELKGTQDRDQLRQIANEVDVTGELKLNPDGKRVERTTLKVKSKQAYSERSFVEKNKLSPITAVRSYSSAAADIEIGQAKFQNRLSKDRQVIALHQSTDRATLFSPYGPLTRDELELVDVPGDIRNLIGFLPAMTVKAGESWAVSDAAIAPLFCFDAVTSSEMKGTLVSVKGNIATLQFEGTASGAAGGIATEVELKAKAHFDLKQQEFTWFGAAFRENREIGHAEPGFETVTKVAVTASPLPKVSALTDDAIAEMKLDPTALPTFLQHNGNAAGYSMLIDRRWRVLANRDDVTILRMIDRGDLIAQCNVSMLPKLAAGKFTTLDEMQADIKKSLDKNFGQFLEANQSLTSDDLRVLRVVAAGQTAELPVQWVYYLIANNEGRRVALVFTLEANLVERFAEVDRAMTSSFRFEQPENSRSAPQLSAPRNDNDEKPTPATATSGETNRK